MCCVGVRYIVLSALRGVSIGDTVGLCFFRGGKFYTGLLDAAAGRSPDEAVVPDGLDRSK